MGKKAKHKGGHAATLDRTLTTPEARAQQWEQRHRAGQQAHEARQRARGAFRRNARVDAAMQQLLSTTEDPRGALGLATHYQTHCQWQERPQGGLVPYRGTPDYRSMTDEWVDHLERTMRGWTLEPPPLGSGHGTDAAPTQARGERRGATVDGLRDVDVGALDRARARLEREDPALSFAFEECCMRGQTEASVGARLGVQQRQASRLKWRAIEQIRAWMAAPDGEGTAAAPGSGQDNGAHV